MKPLHAFSPFNIDSISPRLLLCAAAMAVALLAVFVDLLHESMARGVQWRETQRISDTVSPTKPASTAIAQLR